MAFDLPIPANILCTTSCITYAQSTGLSFDKAPKIVFPTVIVTRIGFSRYNIGIKNSRNRLALMSLHSEIAYPSLGLTRVENLPSMYWSVYNAIPSLCLGKP